MAQDSYDSMLPLMGLGAGLLQAAGPTTQPTSLGSGLGQGLLGGMQGMQMMGEQQDRRRARRLQELQLNLAMVKAQKEQAQELSRQQALAKYTQGLSPDQAAMANLAPDKFLEAQIGRQFAEPKAPPRSTINRGGVEVTQDWFPDKGWVDVGSGPRWAPQAPVQAPETWRLMTAEEKKAAGIPDSVAMSVSNRGQMQKEFDGTEKSGTPTALGKLYDEMNSLAPDDPRRPSYEAAIKKEITTSKGIKVNSDGSVEIGGSDMPMTTQGQNKISEFRAAREHLNGSIKRYEELVNDTGGAMAPGAKKAALDAARVAVMMGTKDLYQLGAVTGPDMDLLDALVPPATGVNGLYEVKPRVAAGLGQLKSEIDSLTTSVERGYGGDKAVSGAKPPAAASPTVPVQAPAPAAPQAGPTVEAAQRQPAPAQASVVPQAQAAQPAGNDDWNQMFGLQ